jgi:hexokinase
LRIDDFGLRILAAIRIRNLQSIIQNGRLAVDKTKEKVVSFLRKQGMWHADIDIQQTSRSFLQAMDNGLAGRKDALAMLPTYVETDKIVPRNQPVIVMDAGGTNFRVAVVSFRDDGKAEISNLKVYSMPGIDREISHDAFFAAMAAYVQDLADKSNHIGFCFSYPVEMFPDKDGRVLYFSKEIKAPEVIGQMIGAGLAAALGQLGNKDKKQIVLLNDTVATLLAGRVDASGRSFDSYIGFILGTGTNTAYIEQNRNITKAKNLAAGKSQIINIESGAFTGAPRGKVDVQLDAASSAPGVNVFEKMISGAYIGPLCAATIPLAAKEGLFTAPAAKQLLRLTDLSTKDVSDFLANPCGTDNPLSRAVHGSTSEDAAGLFCLIDSLVERAAKLTAINLSSTAIKSGKGQHPCRPICIVAEGTTFYRLTSMRQKVEYYLKQYMVDQEGVYYEIMSVDNATLIGAAIAGLTN